MIVIVADPLSIEVTDCVGESLGEPRPVLVVLPVRVPEPVAQLVNVVEAVIDAERDALGEPETEGVFFEVATVDGVRIEEGD